MARLVSLRGRFFVHDLVWTRLPDRSSSTLASNAGGADMAVTLAIGELDVNVGFLHSEGLEAKASRRPISFAALVALVFKTESSLLLFVTVADSKDAILVAVRNGAPVPDYDRYGPAEALIGTAHAYLREHHGSRIVSNTDLFGAADDFDLDGFLASPVTRKLYAKATLSTVGRRHRGVYLTLALALFAGYVVYDQYAERQQAAEAARLAAQQPSPQTLYANALPETIAGEGFMPADAAKMIETIEAMDVTAAGWRISKIRCTAVGCTATWTRQAKGASFEDLAARLGANAPSLLTDQSAMQKIPFAAQKATLDRTRLKTEQEIWSGLLSPLQRLGSAVSYSVTPATPLEAGGVTPNPGAIAKGQLEVQGPLWLMQSLPGLPAYALVREFSVAPTPQSASFVMTIVYFAR